MPVYFISDNENKDYDRLTIKIGRSRDIEKRLRQLQSGSPRQLKIMGWIVSEDDTALEKQLHTKYCSAHSHLEWFTLSAPDIFDELKRHASRSFIATEDNAFEIISYDKDAIPELVGAWKWGDTEVDEFCPQCGWGGGMDYNENYGGLRCLNCGLMEFQMSPPDLNDE